MALLQQQGSRVCLDTGCGMLHKFREIYYGKAPLLTSHFYIPPRNLYDTLTNMKYRIQLPKQPIGNQQWCRPSNYFDPGPCALRGRNQQACFESRAPLLPKRKVTWEVTFLTFCRRSVLRLSKIPFARSLPTTVRLAPVSTTPSAPTVSIKTASPISLLPGF